MAEKDLGPWSVVNDYTKTVVTLAAAILAFTAAFASRVTVISNEVWISYVLYFAWLLLVVSIAAALFSAGRLTGYLSGNTTTPKSFLLWANISYFALFGAVLTFFVFAIATTATLSPNVESINAVKTAKDYAERVEPSFAGQVVLQEVTWNPNSSQWTVRLEAGTASFSVTVDPNAMKVTRFAK